MAQIFTVQLGEGTGNSGDILWLHTAAAGVVTELRDLVFSNNSTAAAFVSVYEDTGTSSIFLYRGQQQPLTSFHLDIRQVLPPGVVLKVNSDATAWTAVATGYVFSEAVPRETRLVGNFPTKDQ
jgi:hypothetical protein